MVKVTGPIACGCGGEFFVCPKPASIAKPEKIAALIWIEKPFAMIFRSGDIAKPSKKELSVWLDSLPGILGPGF
jgi:hypothetical protein